MRCQTAEIKINHPSRMTKPTDDASGMKIASIPQINIRTPQTVDLSRALLTSEVSEAIIYL